MCDSGVPILNHESKSIQWVLVYTISQSLYHEFKFIPWVLLYIMYPILNHESKSIPWVLYIKYLSLYHESKSIPWIQVYTTLALKASEEIQFHIKKKFNFKSEQIPVHIGTNPVSHLKKSHFTMEQIQFLIWRNPILPWNKSNFTLEQIQLQIGTNSISYWNKSNITLQKIKFHIGAIPCQRSEKKGQPQKVDFFYEMWKIIRQIDDFGRFWTTFVILGCFKPKIKNLQKWLFWKSEFFLIFFF